MSSHGTKSELACKVCGKPNEITFEECHDTFGQNNPLCNKANTCRISEKTDEQIGYVVSSFKGNVFLKACPGSGKTESVGLKAAYEIKKWDVKVGGVAVLTFTNSAADVITDRVTQFAGIDKLHYPHFIGTIDSWLHGYIAHSFSNIITGYKGRGGDCSLRIVNENSDDDWLNAFKLDTAYSYYKENNRGPKILASMPLYTNNIRYDYENDRWEIKKPISKSNEYIRDDEYFASEAFTEFRSDKSWLTLEYLRDKFKANKERFHQGGFATYQDIENICYRLLCNNSYLAQLLADRFPFLIIDECQDLSWIQLQIFKKLIEAGSRIHFVGDLNQGIYAFKKVSPHKVNEFIKVNKFMTLELSRNFRSIQPIVTLCGKLVAQGDVQGESSSEGHDPSCVYFTYDKGGTQKIVEHFVSCLEERDIAPEKSAIVARGHSIVNKLRPAASKIPHNKQLRLATAIHLWQNGGVELMGEALNCIGRFVVDNFFTAESTNSRAYYCPDCESSNMRWRLFLAQILDQCEETESLRNLDQIWSGWAKLVREEFEEIVKSCSKIELPFQSNRSFSFSSLRGKANHSVISTLETVDKNNVSNILVTTFHQVKGQTFDAILVVSAPDKRSEGGHWSQWINAGNSEGEHARFAYVASSRPRVLLGWAVPFLSGDEETQLKELGFTRIGEAGGFGC